MFFKSIRFRIVVFYMFLLMLTLSAFGITLYEGFSKFLYGDLEDLISARAEGVADSINTYWQVERAEADKDNFIAAARSWVEEKRKDPELMSVFVQILYPNGELVVSSKAMPRITQLSASDLEDIVNGDDSFDTVSGQSADGKKMKFRMYSKPVIEDGKTRYIVQVAAPSDLVTVAMHDLRFILFLLVPLTVVLAGIPGILLVGVTLRPVERMVQTLRQITAENLKLKIHIPDTKDEIKKLADTFNSMIDRLDRSFSSQQRFIQNISHELQVPISIVREEIEAALDKPCSGDEYRACIKKISAAIENFSKIIEEDLLAIGRLDNDDVLLEIKKVNLARLIRKVLAEMKILADKKEIGISFSCPDTIMIDGDAGKLTRLFLELFDNAIKYTFRNGNITIAALKDENSVKVAVSDTGSGIPEYELPYVFDRFYKAGRAPSSKDGFGLGLSNAKSIVEAHKGSIAVESQPGEGSTFTVSLPVSFPG